MGWSRLCGCWMVLAAVAPAAAQVPASLPAAELELAPIGDSGRLGLPHRDVLSIVGESPGPAAGQPQGASAGGAPGDRRVVERRPAPAPASRPASEEAAVGRRESRGGVWRLRDLLPLAVVLAVIAAAAMLVRRCLPSRGMLIGTGGLRVVARVPLSPRQNVVLVRMGRHLVLLGQSPEQITLLMTVTDPDQVALLLGELEGAGREARSGGFAGAMEAEASAYPASEAGEQDPDDPATRAHGQLNTLLEKVRRLTGSRG